MTDSTLLAAARHSYELAVDRAGLTDADRARLWRPERVAEATIGRRGDRTRPGDVVARRHLRKIEGMKTRS